VVCEYVPHPALGRRFVGRDPELLYLQLAAHATGATFDGVEIKTSTCEPHATSRRLLPFYKRNPAFTTPLLTVAVSSGSSATLQRLVQMDVREGTPVAARDHECTCVARLAKWGRPVGPLVNAK